jgi:hypothetical protein
MIYWLSVPKISGVGPRIHSTKRGPYEGSAACGAGKPDGDLIRDSHNDTLH